MKQLNNVTTRTKLLANAGLVILLVAIMSVVVFRGIQASQDRERWVNHTYQVIGHADELLLQLVNMETGYRGFLVTGDEQFLEPYTSGLQQYAAVMVTEEGTKGVETGGKLASQAGQVIHRITGEVEGGAQANTQMATAAHQQMAGMEQIGQAMSRIQQATTQTLRAHARPNEPRRIFMYYHNHCKRQSPPTACEQLGTATVSGSEGICSRLFYRSSWLHRTKQSAA